jgi:hypothetical protein
MRRGNSVFTALRAVTGNVAGLTAVEAETLTITIGAVAGHVTSLTTPEARPRATRATVGLARKRACVLLRAVASHVAWLATVVARVRTTTGVRVVRRSVAPTGAFAGDVARLATPEALLGLGWLLAVARHVARFTAVVADTAHCWFLKIKKKLSRTLDTQPTHAHTHTHTRPLTLTAQNRQ